MAQTEDDSNPGDAIPETVDDSDGAAPDAPDDVTLAADDHSADAPLATIPLDSNRAAASTDLEACDEVTLADDHLRGSATDATLIVTSESLEMLDGDETAMSGEDGSVDDGTHHRPADGSTDESAACSRDDSPQPGELTLAENAVNEGRSGSAKKLSSRFSGRASDTEDPSGDHSIQRYRFVEEIVRGGMGRIMRAVDPQLHREVAGEIESALQMPQTLRR